jgi:signal transduction histidine kinase
MPWSRVTPATREFLLAAGLTVAVEVELGLSGGTPVQAIAALLVTVPLVFRFRAPMAVLTLVLSGVVVGAALGGNPTLGPVFPVIAVLLALYAVGSRAGRWRLVCGAGVTFPALLAASLLAGADAGAGVTVALAVVVCGLLIGGAMGVLRLESDLFSERASELERERDERARVAVGEERRRIARELHDVIGQSISVMGVQAAAVRSVLRDDQRRERDALLAVERTGRQAVGEMRRLLGLLRADHEGVGDPTPSLRSVEQLVSEMRDAGLSVQLTMHGDLAALSSGVDLAGYRIVQEALTNALKHAPGADVDATVNCTKYELVIEVVDDGTAAPQTVSGRVGHGLLGMRERTSLYGGELVTGPQAAGGFAVRARLPIEGSA